MIGIRGKQVSRSGRGVVLALGLLAGLTMAAMAARSVAGTARPLTIEQVEELDFGRIAGDVALPGEVVIDPVSGQKTLSGGVVDLGGSHSRATFEISGEAGAEFVITLPGEREIKGQDTEAPGRVVLTDFASSPSRSGVLGPDGRATVYVGATLKMKPGQPGGHYRGPLDIFVDYP